MRPDRAYREARALLDRHYGDELTIANAYIKKAMEWPQIKPEDRKGLNTFSLFLIGCCNAVNDVDYMDEMNNPTNMKCILSKLPFKLKEKWRSYAYDIKERRKKQARFPDLVDFVYHQAKVVNDPLFGDILDATIGNQGKLKEEGQCKKKRDQKEQLRSGHLSKDCKKRASCMDCSLKHPAMHMLHVVKESNRVHLPQLESEVGLLIGANAYKAIEPQEIINSRNDRPYAVVPDKDADLLRFLWWPGGDVSEQVTEYRMCVHLFGATSSPSCASYALRRTAQDAAVTTSPEAIQTVLRNFYVDDLLKSVATEGEAVNLVKELTKLCARGGFHLHKWVSNSRALLCSIPDDERAAEVKDLDLQPDALPVERALGVQWCTNSDSFKFKIQLPDKPCTRRGILSVVSSVYDPMGFLAPLLLPVKLILRDLCKEKRSWDEEIPEKPRRMWQKWIADLDKLSELSSWFQGPSFLSNENEWPEQPKQSTYLPEHDEEVKTSAAVLHTSSVVDNIDPVNQLVEYYSSWHKLKKATAWILHLREMLQYLSEKRKEFEKAAQQSEHDSEKCRSVIKEHMIMCKKNLERKMLTVEDLSKAEIELIKYSQRQTYAEEIKVLRQGHTQRSQTSECQFDISPVRASRGTSEERFSRRD
ncbi:hypothetical protein MHYP_G00088790 [Metynnis hypsauchen]